MNDRPSGEFRLETVLRLAARHEEELSQQVSRLEQAHRSNEAQLRLLEQVQADAMQEARAHRDEGDVNVTWLVQADYFAAALRRRLQQQADQVEVSRLRLEDGRAALLMATQKRRMLEKLKEQQRERWQAELDRVEAATLSELSTTRYVRQRAGEPIEHALIWGPGAA